MVDDLGIRGVQPIDDRTPDNQGRKRGDKGKKFSLEGGAEDREAIQRKKRKPVFGKSVYEPSAPEGEEEGGIDIIV